MHEFLSLIYFLLSPFITESIRRFMHTIAFAVYPFEALFHLYLFFRWFSFGFSDGKIWLTADVAESYSEEIVYCATRTIKFNNFFWQHLLRFSVSSIRACNDWVWINNIAFIHGATNSIFTLWSTVACDNNLTWFFVDFTDARPLATD